jgi:hypothetical protein
MSEKTTIERKRVYSHLTRSRFLHVEDALGIGKLRLYVGEYRRGKGASSTAYHFLDVNEARVLFSDLAWAKPVDFGPDYKGTANGDNPQSRVLKVRTKEDRVWVEVANGPGEVVGEGAVKPKGKPDAAVSVPLTAWEARKLAFAVLAYVRAWEARYLLDTASAAPAPAPSPAQGVGQAPSSKSGGEGREVEPTSTGFWTLYNAEGRAAGVDYPLAQRIANEVGDDWHKAILELCAAIDEATAKALD